MEAGERGGGHGCSCQGTEGNTAVVEGRVTVKSVSLLWSVMSALLLKIAQEEPQGGVTGVKQGTLDESQGPGGSYSECCLEEGVTLEMGVSEHVML